MNTQAAVLQPAQQRFADEYLIDFAPGAAYMRAGYKAKGGAASASASRLLARPEVQSYLAKRRAEQASKFEATQEEVIRRLACMALGDIRALYRPDGSLKGIHELTIEESSLIQGIEVDEIFAASVKGKDGKADEPRIGIGYTTKIKIVDRHAVAKTLGQHFGLFNTKKVEHSGPGGGPIQSVHSAMGDLLELVDGADTGTGAAASRR